MLKRHKSTSGGETVTWQGGVKEATLCKPDCARPMPQFFGLSEGLATLLLCLATAHYNHGTSVFHAAAAAALEKYGGPGHLHKVSSSTAGASS